MKINQYDKNKAIEYARKWAYLRNSEYYNYDELGGDCTNFISQCIFNGSHIMNYNKNGWYYNNGNDKSPSWTGVEFIYNFLINNESIGPFGKQIDIENLEIGDIIQLAFDNKKFGHSLIVVKKEENNIENIYTATHTFDSYLRRISTYEFVNIRYIHINGVRNW